MNEIAADTTVSQYKMLKSLLDDVGLAAILTALLQMSDKNPCNRIVLKNALELREEIDEMLND